VSRGSEEDDGSAGEEEGGVFRAGEEAAADGSPGTAARKRRTVFASCLLEKRSLRFLSFLLCSTQTTKCMPYLPTDGWSQSKAGSEFFLFLHFYFLFFQKYMARGKNCKTIHLTS
jgi:hypothetical protein